MFFVEDVRQSWKHIGGNMNNDIIYCYHCKRTFKDTLRKYKYYAVQDTLLEDSKFNLRYRNICPHCLSRNTTNVSKMLLEGDSLSRNYGGYESFGNWAPRKFYLKVKKALRKSRR